MTTRGLRPGFVLVGLLLVAANLRASITSVGPVLDTVRADLGFSAMTASVLISLPLIAFAVISPLAPPLARRIGIERSLGVALVALAASIVLRSAPFTGAIWLGTAGLGCAIAILNVTIPALVKRDFPTGIGPVTGLYSAVQSGMAGIAAGVSVPIAGMAEHGWRVSLGLWAGLALIAFAVFAPQLRSRSRLAGPIEPVAGHRSPWRTALGWQVTLFMGLQSTGFYVLITWMPSIEQAAGIAPATAGLHQSALNAAGLLATLGAAALLKRSRDQRALIAAATIMMTVSLTGLALAPSLGLLWAIAGGLGCGAAIVVALSLFGLRTAHHDQAARLSGMAQSIGYLIAACGPILIGALHDVTGSWASALAPMVVVLGVQLVMGLLAGRDRVL